MRRGEGDEAAMNISCPVCGTMVMPPMGVSSAACDECGEVVSVPKPKPVAATIIADPKPEPPPPTNALPQPRCIHCKGKMVEKQKKLGTPILGLAFLLSGLLILVISSITFCITAPVLIPLGAVLCVFSLFRFSRLMWAWKCEDCGYFYFSE